MLKLISLAEKVHIHFGTCPYPFNFLLMLKYIFRFGFLTLFPILLSLNNPCLPGFSSLSAFFFLYILFCLNKYIFLSLILNQSFSLSIFFFSISLSLVSLLLYLSYSLSFPYLFLERISPRGAYSCFYVMLSKEISDIYILPKGQKKNMIGT